VGHRLEVAVEVEAEVRGREEVVEGKEDPEGSRRFRRRLRGRPKGLRWSL